MADDEHREARLSALKVARLLKSFITGLDNVKIDRDTQAKRLKELDSFLHYIHSLDLDEALAANETEYSKAPPSYYDFFGGNDSMNSIGCYC